MNEDQDPAPNFDEDQSWIDDEVTEALNHLAEVFWNAGCNVNGVVITVPSLPGLNAEIQTDYGVIKVVAQEVA